MVLQSWEKQTGESWKGGSQAAQLISRSSLPWDLEISCGSLPGIFSVQRQSQMWPLQRPGGSFFPQAGTTL